ncbi:MAG: nucleotide exchange factor GrpE [Treponema sp.]|jgi:molecular chaperone GrpE (heat shock protein)|nr:nucleotide exchange factor GrpE [Treponema sp.]
MINFETELNKLLSLETGELPDYEFAEIAAAGREILAEFDKKQTDTSLQIEEIYDLVKEQDFLRETAASERARADRLIPAIIGLADLLEDFYAYAGQSGSEELKHQAKLQRENAGGILSSCGVLRFGEAGQALNPQYHTVKASVESPFPKEQVVQVLQSGYVYQGAIVRKAAVVVSRGQVPEETSIIDHDDDQEYDKGEQEDEQNSWY